MTPIFQIAARGPDGKAGLMRVQHEEILTIECALQLTKEQLPDAKVILVAVPKDGIYARSETVDGSAGSAIETSAAG